ncbi:Protein of unknown function, partial [Gryllus bimaculatus]
MNTLYGDTTLTWQDGDFPKTVCLTTSEENDTASQNLLRHHQNKKEELSRAWSLVYSAMLVSRTLLAVALALALPCARAAPLGAAEAVGRGRWGLEAPRALQQPGEALQRLSPFAAAAPPAPPAPAVDAGA